MRKFSKKIDPGFPSFGDKLKAEDYWKSINRHDLIRMTDQIVAEFRAHHEMKGTMSPTWSAVWKTWYVRAPRYIKSPGVRAKREPFRAPVETETTVPLSMVRDFAKQLADKARR